MTGKEWAILICSIVMAGWVACVIYGIVKLKKKRGKKNV